LAGAHPFDEPTQAALIEALAAAGRLDDAREWYRLSRQRLADQLGMDPGEQLRAAYEQLLRPAAESATAGRARCTLPAALADFTGRADELDAVRTAVARSGLVVIGGPGGFGATTLAVYAAHTLRGAFPAGQLFASGADVLGQFERQWGAPLTAEPGLLLVADRPVDLAGLLANQPLGTALIVTTADAAPAGVARVRLRPMTADEAAELLTRVAGRKLIDEPDALDRVLRLCAGSPRALRHAGALLARRPHWTVHDLADSLEQAL
jgi:hypothetical protein